MTTPSRLRALEDLYEACRGLRDDPTATLRVIERVEELDRLVVQPRRLPPPPGPEFVPEPQPHRRKTQRRGPLHPDEAHAHLMQTLAVTMSLMVAVLFFTFTVSLLVGP